MRISLLLHIFLFLFVLSLTSCHSQKESTTSASLESESARSDITNTIIDADLSALMSRDVVITLKDVVVEYDTPADSTNIPAEVSPRIRSPGNPKPSSMRAAEIIISDKTDAASALSVKDRSRVNSTVEDRQAAAISKEEKSSTKRLWPGCWAMIGISLCVSAALIVAILIILYRKGKLRL